jgi:uridine phosphorylase
MYQDYPILEYDGVTEAVLEPKRLFPEAANIPTRGVICFYQDVIDTLLKQRKIQQVSVQRQERLLHPIGAAAMRPIYEMTTKGKNILIFHPGVGSPVAAAMFEEVIALGCKNFISCGSAGALDKSIAIGHIIVPTVAVRDEGVSYHYLPPGREVSANKEGVVAIESVLKYYHCEYLLVKTWTTDAIYRETVARVQRRRAEGCLVVEMEAAALFAIAQFRGVQLAQILYCSDDVSNTDWNAHLWPAREATREKLFWLAVEACLKL